MTEKKFHEVTDKLRIEIAGSPFEDHVFVVGGAVRDLVLKRPINDIDIVIDLPMGGIAFAEWLTRRLGVYKSGSNPILYGRFGTAQFRVFGVEIESVMSRQEAYEVGSRKPAVKFGTMKQDAFRRDLTINALSLNISSKSLLDLTSTGLQDLKDNRIRTTSRPASIFREDPLRMLRAARFAGQLTGTEQFKIDEPTLQAMSSNAHELVNISKERVNAELVKMLMSPNPILGIDLLVYTNLIEFVIPEIKSLVNLTQNKFHNHDVYGHTLLTVIKTEKVLVQRLAALLHDIGKPKVVADNAEGTHSFHGHEKVSAEMATEILTKLKFPKIIIEKVSKIVKMHMLTKMWGKECEDVKDKTLRKFAKKAGSDLEDLLGLIHADNLSHAPEHTMPNQVAKLRERLSTIEARKEPTKMPVNGNDIMTFFEVKTGNQVGTLLKIAEDIFLETPTIQKNSLLLAIKEKVDKINKEFVMKKKIQIMREYTMSIDIDSQKGFTPICPNELPVEGGDLIVDELNKNAGFAMLRVGSKDLHPTSAVWIATNEKPIFTEIKGHGDNVDIRWPAHCMSGTEGAELLDGLPAPEDYDFFVWKGMEPNLHPYGIFYHDLANTLSTGLLEYLMANIEINTFIIGGLALDYCVYESVKQLKMFLDMCEEYDCRIIVNLSATAGVAPDTTAKAVEDLESMGVIFINGADELELIE